MARWRPLAEDMDPHVREFTSQLRRLVERSGVSLSALADATGYSRSSWERYLNGRLLPPKYAVVALADVTHTEPGHLTTMWELAERAWSRAEGRHDATMEAHQVAEARAALGEFGPPPEIRQSRGARSPNRRRAALLGTGVVVAVLAVVGTTVLLGDGRKESGGLSASASAAGGTGTGDDQQASTTGVQEEEGAELPDGVKCAGSGCTGKDPESMGCGGSHAWTAAAAWVGGAYVEMRYSDVCDAVWARISAAGPGDSVNVVTVTDEGGRAGEAKQSQRSEIGQDDDTYTLMMAVSGPTRAKACAELSTGQEGCTSVGGSTPVPKPSG